MLDVTRFIDFNNYFDIDVFCQSNNCFQNGTGILHDYYIEIDTDDIIWLIYPCHHNYQLKSEFKLFTNNDKLNHIDTTNIEFYMRSSTCLKILISNIICPISNWSEICVKLSDDFELNTIISNVMRVCYKCAYTHNYNNYNIITNDYQICNGLLYSIDYLRGDCLIETLPSRLLFNRPIKLYKFLGRYNIKFTDIIISTYNLNHLKLSNIDIKYFDNPHYDLIHPIQPNILYCIKWNDDCLEVDFTSNTFEIVYFELNWIK